MKKIIVDLLGADSGEEVLAQGAVEALEGTDFCIVLVGHRQKLEEALGENINNPRLEIKDAEFTIENTQSPTAVLGDKGLSSVSISYAALKDDDDAIALVSAGNTGALLVGGIYKLGLLEGLKRPCLASVLPTKKAGKNVVLLDCGANLDCKSDTLLSFALLGSSLAGACGVSSPKVALLSVGKEDKKGNLVVKETFELLKQSSLNFIGNAEGYDVLEGDADVIVCDGFYGNVVLKNCEAAAKFALEAYRANLQSAGAYSQEAEKAYGQAYKLFDYNSQGGAVLLGVKKTVVKAHGAADGRTILSCIMQAYNLSNGKKL